MSRPPLAARRPVTILYERLRALGARWGGGGAPIALHVPEVRFSALRLRRRPHSASFQPDVFPVTSPPSKRRSRLKAHRRWLVNVQTETHRMRNTTPPQLERLFLTTRARNEMIFNRGVEYPASRNHSTSMLTAAPSSSATSANPRACRELERSHSLTPTGGEPRLASRSVSARMN